MEFLIFAPMLFVVAFGIWINSVMARNALAQIRAWATSEGYTIIEANRSFTGGPYWYLGRQGMIFRITVENAEGTRQAWVFYPLPLSFFKMRVKWD